MAGKGSRRRPTKVAMEVVDTNYETIFGKYVPLYLRKQLPDEPQAQEEQKGNNDIQQDQRPKE